jgi:Ca2+-binding RTX toxin-like protein
MRKLFDGKERSERIDGSGGDDKIYGNGGNDTLIGHIGEDRIWGGDGNDKIWGGQGEDILKGNAGKDQFRFNSLNELDADTILDFKLGKDKIGLDARVYEQLSGGLLEDNFVFGTDALDADDHLIFNSSTAELFFDPDGNGEAAKIRLATLTNNPEFTFEALFIFGV